MGGRSMNITQITSFLEKLNTLKKGNPDIEETLVSIIEREEQLGTLENNQEVRKALEKFSQADDSAKIRECRNVLITIQNQLELLMKRQICTIYPI